MGQNWVENCEDRSFSPQELRLKGVGNPKTNDTRFNIVLLLLINKCWTLLRLVERNRAKIYFRSTTFNNFQGLSTCWTAYFNVQHYMIHCSTFVEQQLRATNVEPCITGLRIAIRSGKLFIIYQIYIIPSNVFSLLAKFHQKCSNKMKVLKGKLMKKTLHDVSTTSCYHSQNRSW